MLQLWILQNYKLVILFLRLTSFQPTAYTRREQRYLAGVSPLVGWCAWPVTGGG